MAPLILSPAQTTFWSVPGWILFLVLHALGIACFTYIAGKRFAPLRSAERDFRFDRPWLRLRNLLQFWFAQWKHPRYRFAGILHILIFAGFIILAARAFSLLIFGVYPHFVMPGLSGRIYDIVKDYSATVVFLCMVVAATRRAFFRPVRYRKEGTGDAIFLLSLIAVLMAADALFEGAKAAAQKETIRAAFSLPWLCQGVLSPLPFAALARIYLGAYFLHEFVFFFLLCYRPFGVQFHVETSLFSIYFAKLDREIVKPVRCGVAETEIDQVKSFGIKTFADFTWKHILDFYSCADCGRCSDQCPSDAVGRPLSPRLLTVKARDYCFAHYPVFGNVNNSHRLVGEIYSDDEIWSCTTCGACEAECPMLVEYIDKIVDLRRGLVDEGKVPQSLQRPLKSLETRGNPYGKMEKKRADWAKAAGVKVLNGSGNPRTLYFVDSITSYDDRIQAIGRASAKILDHIGEDFGILGAAEKDSGHEVRRFGEEMLFMALRRHNTEAIRAAGVEKIVTADPHAYNALRHDYTDVPPVEHISEVIARAGVKFKRIEDETKIYAYHDPCYLGRHNGVYDAPRLVLDSVPGLRRVEMSRCRDRSFCCGGGGLALFYEPKESERMGVRRVRMAAQAGANVIVTACPFCMVNIEDAIKVAGLEGKMTTVDLTELVTPLLPGA